MKIISLYGELGVSNFQFHKIIPTLDKPMRLSYRLKLFQLFVLKQDIAILSFKKEDFGKDTNIPVKRIFAKFDFECDDKNAINIDSGLEPIGNKIEEYKETLAALRNNLWSYAYYELGQSLKSLDFTEEVRLYKNFGEAITVLRPHKPMTFIIKSLIPSRESLFGVEDIYFFRKYLNFSDREKNKVEWKIFMNAREALKEDDYRVAILEGTIALEVFAKNILSNKLKEDDVEKIDKWFRDVSLFGILKILVYLFPKRNSPLNNDVFLEIIEKGISVRNNIVHNSCLNVKESDCRPYLNKIQELLDFFMPRRVFFKKRQKAGSKKILIYKYASKK